MKAWLKWLGCGALLGLLAWLVAWSVRTLTGGEGAVTWWLALGAIALVPAAASLVSPRVGRLADPALVAVLSAYGVAAIVGVALLVTLLIAGRIPDADAIRPFVVPAVAAIVLAVVLALIFEPRVTRAARQAVYGRTAGSADLARTFGSRMTRAIPLDELALQGAEALREGLVVAPCRTLDPCRRRAPAVDRRPPGRAHGGPDGRPRTRRGGAGGIDRSRMDEGVAAGPADRS